MRRSNSGRTSAALPTRPTERRASLLRLLQQGCNSLIEVAGHAVAIAAVDSLLDALRIDIDAEEARAGHGRGQWLRAAHAAHAAGDDQLALQAAAKMLARRPRQRSRTCPARCPGCRCKSRSRPSSGRTSSGPCAPARGTTSQLDHLPTRLELAISTRGAIVCVRRIRRPACRIGSAAFRRFPALWSARTMAWKHGQSRAALPVPP